MNITKGDVYAHFPSIIDKSVHLDISDGWLGLVEELFTKLDRVNQEFDCNLEVKLIESKFGGLCCGVEQSHSSNCGCIARIDDLITSAEYKSYSVCEVCGDPGTPVVSGQWLITTCKKHS